MEGRANICHCDMSITVMGLSTRAFPLSIDDNKSVGKWLGCFSTSLIRRNTHTNTTIGIQYCAFLYSSICSLLMINLSFTSFNVYPISLLYLWIDVFHIIHANTDSQSRCCSIYNSRQSNCVLIPTPTGSKQHQPLSMQSKTRSNTDTFSRGEKTMKSIANTDYLFLSAFSCLFSPARYHTDSSRRQLNGETEGYSKVCWCEEKKNRSTWVRKTTQLFYLTARLFKTLSTRREPSDWSMPRRLSESLRVSPVNIVSKLIWLASWRR